MSDSVVNYLTVSSFGNEDLIVKKYKTKLMANHIRLFINSNVTGFVVGVSEFL